MTENELSHSIIESAIEVHKVLGGPGLLESVYEESLVWELQQKGLKISRQVEVPISYKGNSLASPLRLDLLVNNQIILEVKATTNNNPLYAAQLLTYLRLLDMKLGLVLNFGYPVLKDGIHRVVNRL